jgi:hypothetical protein
MQLKPNAPETMDQDGLSDLDRALVEAAEEMRFDWPEFPALGRIIPAMMRFVPNWLLLAGLAVLGGVFLLFFAS